jgi:uncharacterized paraquat-inducible protein A
LSNGCEEDLDIPLTGAVNKGEEKCCFCLRKVKYQFLGCHKMMWVPLLIAVSATLNIQALYTTFMTVQTYHEPLLTLNLLSLINVMFDANIIWPTYIIIVCSVVFPLFKLANLVILWFSPWHCSVSRRWLRTLSYLGRFSYMDIFVELTVLNMAHN